MNTLLIIMIISGYIFTIIACFLQYYVYEKRAIKDGNDYNISLFFEDTSKINLFSIKFLTTEFDISLSVGVAMFMVFYLSDFKNTDFTIIEKVIWGFLILLLIYFPSKIISYFLYKLYMSKRKQINKR